MINKKLEESVTTAAVPQEEEVNRLLEDDMFISLIVDYFFVTRKVSGPAS